MSRFVSPVGGEVGDPPLGGRQRRRRPPSASLRGRAPVGVELGAHVLGQAGRVAGGRQLERAPQRLARLGRAGARGAAPTPSAASALACSSRAAEPLEHRDGLLQLREPVARRAASPSTRSARPTAPGAPQRARERQLLLGERERLVAAAEPVERLRRRARATATRPGSSTHGEARAASSRAARERRLPASPSAASSSQPRAAASSAPRRSRRRCRAPALERAPRAGDVAALEQDLGEERAVDVAPSAGAEAPQLGQLDRRPGEQRLRAGQVAAAQQREPAPQRARR